MTECYHYNRFLRSISSAWICIFVLVTLKRQLSINLVYSMVYFIQFWQCCILHWAKFVSQPRNEVKILTAANMHVYIPFSRRVHKWNGQLKAEVEQKNLEH